MGLEARYRDAFSKSQKERGQELYEGQSVSYIQGSDSSVSAEVSDGSNIREVSLECSNKELQISCDCQEILNKPCEHIWASLLASENLKLLKDGSKRGVRLHGTAASKKPILKKASKKAVFAPSITTHPNTDSEAIVDKDILYVINKSKSSWFDSWCIEFYWRPLNELGPIKPYTPDVNNAGLELSDKAIFQELGSYSPSVLLKDPTKILRVLGTLFEEQKLYTRLDSTQFKFAKVKEKVEEEIDWQIELNSDGYEINGLCNGEPLRNICALSSSVLLLPRTLVLNNFQVLDHLQAYQEPF